MTEDATPPTSDWSRIVAENKPVTLNAQEIDQIVAILFKTQSANFEMLSAIFKLVSQNPAEAFELADQALATLVDANERLSTFHDSLVQRLK